MKVRLPHLLLFHINITISRSVANAHTHQQSLLDLVAIAEKKRPEQRPLGAVLDDKVWPL